jgi:RND family efflux transporter MFP subunit
MADRTALLQQLAINRTAAPQSQFKNQRWHWLTCVVVLVVAGSTIGAWVLWRAYDGVPVHAVIARPVVTVTELPASSVPVLDASGYIVALREATVSAKAIYKVIEVLVEEGQSVKQGQVIARLDDSNAVAVLEQSRAQVKQLAIVLAAAKLAADDARPLFLRNQKQLAQGLISPEAFDAAKGSYDAVESAVRIAGGNLAVATATLQVNQRYEDDTLIRAPFDGVVTVRTAQPGEIVSPQFSGGGGILRIVDMDSLEVDVDVNENSINRVHPKQSTTITLNAYPEWRIPAEVIAVIPTADRTKATMKVRIGFKQRDPRILPEMGARVTFLEQSHQSRADSSRLGLLLPVEAVQVSGNTGAVFVINDTVVVRRMVELGARGASDQTILSGLEPGALVAIGDLGKLRDGARVRVAQ